MGFAFACSCTSRTYPCQAPSRCLRKPFRMREWVNEWTKERKQEAFAASRCGPRAGLSRARCTPLASVESSRLVCCWLLASRSLPPAHVSES